MRIALVSQYYAPEPAKTAVSVARGLARQGHRVHVVTGFPNYPSGRVYPGYRQSLRHVEDDVPGVRVRRVPLVPSHSGDAALRALNYLSFAVSSLLGSWFVRGADVTYVYASQPTGALAAMVWRLLRGRPYVLHVQDLWPDSVTASGMVGGWRARAVARALHTLLRPVYANASGVVVISAHMRTTLVERGVDPDRVHVVHNWSADESAHASRAPGSGPGCTVTFAGNVGAAQDLETAVQAARLVADELPGFTLLVVGAGTRRDALRELARDVPCVEFRDPVPFAQMPSVYRETTFQLVPLKATANLHGAVPSKLQSSLAAGLPVICSAPGAATDLVRQADAGLVVPPGDAPALADAFRKAYACTPEEYQRLVGNARRFYLDRLSSAAGLAQLEQVLAGAAARRGARPGRPTRRPDHDRTETPR